MIAPNRIADTFKVSQFSACMALLIIRGRVNPANHPRRFPQLAAWLRKCYHEPNRREQKLEALNELLGTYGVEALRVEGAWVDSYHGDIVASYLNTGDTYSNTLVVDSESGRWRLTSWGNFYEAYETAHPELVEAQ